MPPSIEVSVDPLCATWSERGSYRDARLAAIETAIETTLISPDEYFRTLGDYEIEPDYVDGLIEPRHGGERSHSRCKTVLVAWLCQEDRERGWNTFSVMSLTVQVSATRFRVADVVLMDRNKPVEQIPTIAPVPVPVFEVLSSEDCAINLLRKLADYEQMGITFIRVINPGSGLIYAYANGELRPMDFSSDELPDGCCAIDSDQVRPSR